MISWHLSLSRFAKTAAFIAAVLLSLWILSLHPVLAQDIQPVSTAAAPDAPVLLLPVDGALVTGVTHPPLGVPTLT